MAVAAHSLPSWPLLRRSLMLHVTSRQLQRSPLLTRHLRHALSLRYATHQAKPKRRVLDSPPEQDLRPPLRWGPALFKIANFAIIPCNVALSLGHTATDPASPSRPHLCRLFRRFWRTRTCFQPRKQLRSFRQFRCPDNFPPNRSLSGQKMVRTPKGVFLLPLTRRT